MRPLNELRLRPGLPTGPSHAPVTVSLVAGTALGGRIYDATQDYTAMWWAAVVLGLLAALIHLPIREQPGPLALAEAS